MPDQENQRGLKVVKLEQPAEGRRPGRPRKLVMPPLPRELLDSMTELERDHYHYFVRAFREEYPDLTATDLIMLHQAALEYINLLRVQANQLQTGIVLTMSRQHPGVQLRQWLDGLSVTRKQRPRDDSKQREEVEQLLRSLSGE